MVKCLMINIKYLSNGPWLSLFKDELVWGPKSKKIPEFWQESGLEPAFPPYLCYKKKLKTFHLIGVNK